MKKIYKTYKGLSIPEHDFNSITGCHVSGYCVECLFSISNLEILKEWHNKQLREKKLERILSDKI